MKRLSVQYHDKTTNMSLPGAGVLSAIVTVVDGSDHHPREDDDVFLSLGGLDSTTKQHLEWDRVEFRSGDTIEITVLDDQGTDPPRTIRDGDCDEYLEMTKKRVRALAAELGWTIIEDPTGE